MASESPPGVCATGRDPPDTTCPRGAGTAVRHDGARGVTLSAMRAVPTALLVLSLGACANTVDGSRGARMDAAAQPDVPPGRNPDGFDPFRPADVPLRIDAAVDDTDPWDLRDATVFDQRLASFTIGLQGGDVDDTTNYFGATFRLFPRPDEPRCEYVAAGAWSVQRCRQDIASVRDPHPTPFPNGGELRLTGGIRDLILRPGTNGTYAAQSTSDTVFREQAVVTLRSAGNAAVPALMVPVPIPPALRLRSPASLSNLDVPRGADLVVTWDPIAARLVVVTLNFVEDGPPRTSIRVDVQAAGDEGRAVIPARVLRTLFADMPPRVGGITVQPTNLVLSRAGAWPVQVTAFGRALTGSVRLQ